MDTGTEKNLYVEKSDLQLTKNQFFWRGNLSTFINSNFSNMNIKKQYNKVYIAKKHNK